MLSKPKAALKSKTILGSLLALVGYLINAFGLDQYITEAEAGTFLTTIAQLVDVVMFLAGFVLTIYGRIKARRPIEGVVSTDTVKSLLAFVLLSSLLFQVACGPDKALVALASGMEGAVTIKRDLAAQGEIDRDTDLSMTRALLEADRTLIRIADDAQCFEAFTQNAKKALVDGFNQTITTLDNLHRDGALRFKSERARKNFSRAITATRLAAAGIRTTIELMPVTDNSQPVELTDKQRRALEEFRATCKRALELFRDNEKLLLDDLKRLEPDTL